MENLTEMETTIIELPYEIGQEAFYLKDNQLKSGKIWRIDAEVTENEMRFKIWFKLEDYKSDLVNYEHTFNTKEQAIDYVTSQLK
jgi:hypothetical protein